MLFEHSLKRELAYTAAVVFMVLLTIMLITMIIRIVGFAASSHVDPRDVFVLIGLTLIGYLAIMLCITLFSSVLFVLMRWYRDSEMMVWATSGVSLIQLIRPIGIFSAPFILAIAVFSFVGWPWSNEQSKLLRERFAQRDELALITSGQFRETPASQRVFFVEKFSPQEKTVQNVFLAHTGMNKISVVVASQGRLETQPNGERFVILEKGHRYDGPVNQSSYRMMDFQRYGVRINTQQFINSPTAKSTATLDLLRHPTPDHLGEFAWRLSLPLIALNLMLLAIPLAYQGPRHGRTFNVLAAALIYLSYSNLLNVVQLWIEQSKISLGLGLLSLHLTVMAIVIGWFGFRLRFHSRFRIIRKTFQ